MDTVIINTKQENTSNILEINPASSIVTTIPQSSPTSPMNTTTETSTSTKPKSNEDVTHSNKKKSKPVKKHGNHNTNNNICPSGVVVDNDADKGEKSAETIGDGSEKCCSFKIIISVWFSLILVAGWFLPVLISLNFAIEAATESLISLGQETTENMITKLESTLQDGSIASQSLINLTSIYGEWNTTTRFSSSNSSTIVEATPEIKVKLFLSRAAALALNARPDQWTSIVIRWARGASFQATQIQPSLLHTQLCFGNGVFVKGVTTANTNENYNMTNCIVESFNLTAKSMLPPSDVANTLLLILRGRVFALGPIWNATIAAMKSSATLANTPFPAGPIFTQYADIAGGNGGMQFPSFTCTKSQFEPTHLLPRTSPLYYNPAAFTSVAGSGVDTAGFASVLSSLLPPEIRDSARAFVTAKVDSVLRVLFWSHGSPITVFPYNASSSSFVPEACYLNGRADYMGCLLNMSDYAGFELLVRASAAALSPSATFRVSQYLTPTQNESFTVRTAFFFPEFDKSDDGGGDSSIVAHPPRTDILFDRGAFLYTCFQNLTLFSRNVDIHVFLPVNFFMENMRVSARTSIVVAVAIFVVAFIIGIVSLNRISSSVEALVEELAADPFCERKDNLHEKKKNRFAEHDKNNNNIKKKNDAHRATFFPGEEGLHQLEHVDGGEEEEVTLPPRNSSSSSFSYWNEVKDLFTFTELTMVEEAFLELQDCFQQLRSFMPYQTTKNVGNTRKIKSNNNNDKNDFKLIRTNVVDTEIVTSVITAPNPEGDRNKTNNNNNVDGEINWRHHEGNQQNLTTSNADTSLGTPANSSNVLGIRNNNNNDNNSTKLFTSSMNESNNYDDDDLTASTVGGDDVDDLESTVSNNFPATTLSGGAAVVTTRPSHSNNNNDSAVEASLSSSSSSRSTKKIVVIQQRGSIHQTSTTKKSGNDDDESDDNNINNFSDNNNNNSVKNETAKSLNNGSGGVETGSGTAAKLLSASVGGSSNSILKKSVQSPHHEMMMMMNSDKNMNSNDLTLLNGSNSPEQQQQTQNGAAPVTTEKTPIPTFAESNRQQQQEQQQHNRKNVTFNRTAIVAVPLDEDPDENNASSDESRSKTPQECDGSNDYTNNKSNNNDDFDEPSTTPNNESKKSSFARTSSRDRMEEIRIKLSSGSDDDDDDDDDEECDTRENEKQGEDGHQNTGNDAGKNTGARAAAARLSSPLHFNNTGRQSPSNYLGTATSSPTKLKRRNNNNTSPSNADTEKFEQENNSNNNNTNDGTARYMIACVTVLGNEVLSELLLLFETHRELDNNHDHSKNKNNHSNLPHRNHDDHMFGSSENFPCCDDGHGSFPTAASFQQQERKESTSQKNTKSGVSSSNNNNKAKNSYATRTNGNDDDDDASDATDGVENQILHLMQQQQQSSAEASAHTSNKIGENHTISMFSLVTNQREGGYHNNNNRGNFKNRRSTSNDGSHTSSASTAQSSSGGSSSNGRIEISKQGTVGKNNKNNNDDGVASERNAPIGQQRVVDGANDKSQRRCCPAFTRYHEAVLKNILKLYLPSTSSSSSLAFATGAKNTGGESPPSSKNIFSEKFSEKQHELLEKVASTSRKFNKNNYQNENVVNGEQIPNFIPRSSSSVTMPPQTITTQNNNNNNNNNNNKTASSPSAKGVTIKDLSILGNGTSSHDTSSKQLFHHLQQQQQLKIQEVLIDFASPVQLSALKQYIIDRSKFIVDSIFNHLLKGSGGHVIEYRNDSFLICLRLSRKNAHSRLAQRFLFNLTKVSDVIKASETFFAPFYRDDDVVKTNWTLRGLAYRNKREELMQTERLMHQARLQKNAKSRDDGDSTIDPSRDHERATGKTGTKKSSSSNKKKKSASNLRLSALRQEGSSFSAMNTALTAGLSVGRVKILHMTANGNTNNNNKNKNKNKENNTFLTKNNIHCQINQQSNNNNKDDNNDEKFKDIRSATSFASGNQTGNIHHNNNNNNTFDPSTNTNTNHNNNNNNNNNNEHHHHQQKRRNEFNAAAISARPVTVLGHCVSEAILLESEIRKEVLLGRGFFVDVEPAALTYVKHVFGFMAPPPSSPTDVAAPPLLPSNFEHRNFPEQQYLDSLSHAICFVVQSASETLKNPISFYVSSDFTFNLKKSASFGSNTLFDVRKNNNNQNQGTCSGNFLFSNSNDNMGIGIDEDEVTTPRINVLEIGRVLTAAFPSPLKALISSDFSEQQRQLLQRKQQLDQEEAEEEAEKERQLIAREKAEREEEMRQKQLQKEAERREKRRKRKEEEKLAKEMFKTQDTEQMLMELELEEESLRNNIAEEEHDGKSQIDRTIDSVI